MDRYWEDLLSGTLLSSTVVIISYSFPDILSKMFSPYMVKRISFQWSIALMTLLFVVSLLIIVVAEDVRLRIVGVFVIGIANGIAVITCVRMLAYYEQSRVLASAYQNADNAAMFLASLGYTGNLKYITYVQQVLPRLYKTRQTYRHPVYWTLTLFWFKFNI